MAAIRPIIGWPALTATGTRRIRSDVTDHNGRELRMIYRVTSEIGDMITVTETAATRDDEPLRVDPAVMRFLDEATLDAFLGEAGFAIEARYGDFTGGPFTDASASIVTVARRVS